MAGVLLGSLAIADDANAPNILGAVAALMVIVGLLVCTVPAIRALRIDPAEALREA